MARARRPEDWQRDLEGARAGEAWLAAQLASDPRVAGLEDDTGSFHRLDFSFIYEGERVQVDLKEKRQHYSKGVTRLWPTVPARDLFVLDETVYRRIVWHGGGGYLVVRDHPGGRWAMFGPWELTLGPRVRYTRWGDRAAGRFAKGKVLLDLRTAGSRAKSFSVDDLLGMIRVSRAQREAVEAVQIPGLTLPEVGGAEPSLF